MKKLIYNWPKAKNTFIGLLHFNLTVWFWDYLMILLVAKQFFLLWILTYLMVDSRLTVLETYTKSLWNTCLLGLLHDVDAPQCLVIIWVTQMRINGYIIKLSIVAALICHIYWRTQTRVMFRPSRSGSSVHWSVVSFCQKEGRHHTMGSGRGV